MNRQDRRALAKPGVAAAVVQAAIEQQRRQLEDETVYNYTALILWVLHDKFGFGTKRIAKLHHELAQMSGFLKTGEVNIEDIVAALDRECGINLSVKEIKA